MVAGWGIGRLIGEDTFKVGSCVKVKDRTLDNDLEAASCPSGYGDPSDSVYRVGMVIDGSDATCPPMDGAAVEFSHEPHDKTYCLIYPSYSAPGGDSDYSGSEDDYTGDGEPPECTEARLNGEPLPAGCP